MSAISSRSRVVDDLAILVAIGKAVDAGKGPPFGDFLAGEIKFLAADPINGLGRLQGFRGHDGGVGADEADDGVRLLLLDCLRHFAVVFE